MNEDKISTAAKEQKDLLDAVLDTQKPVLLDIASQLVASFHQGGRLFLVGTGPFGAIASLLGQNFIHRQTLERPALPAIALTNDSGLATFLAADNLSNQVFSRQLRAMATAEDSVLVFGGTGIDPACQEVLSTAQHLGCYTIVIASDNTEFMDRPPDTSVPVPSNSEPRLMECTLFLGNLLCTLVESELFGI